MKIKIIRYMDGFAIKIKHGFFYKTVEHGTFFPPYNFKEEGEVIKFKSLKEAKTWLMDTFPHTAFQIVSQPLNANAEEPLIPQKFRNPFKTQSTSSLDV